MMKPSFIVHFVFLTLYLLSWPCGRRADVPPGSGGSIVLGSGGSTVSGSGSGENINTTGDQAMSSPPPETPTVTRPFFVDYTLMTANSPDCEPSLVDDFPVQIQYRQIETAAVTPQGVANNNVTGAIASAWMDSPNPPDRISGSDCENRLASNRGSVHVTVRNYSVYFPNSIIQVAANQTIQLRMVQLDHRGGFCDCWAVSDINIRFEDDVPVGQTCDTSGSGYSSLNDFLNNFNLEDTITCTGLTVSTNPAVQGFCGGSASVPRGFVSVEVGASNAGSQCASEAAVVDSGKNGPTVGDQCDDQPHVQVQFTLQLGGRVSGNSLNSFDEGVEFAFKNLNTSQEWIPLMFFSRADSNKNLRRGNNIYVGEIPTDQDVVIIRGYNVSFKMIGNGEENKVEYAIKICGKEIMQSNGVLLSCMKFRWLQTVSQVRNRPNRDIILLDDVVVRAYSDQQQNLVVFKDSFNNQASINNFNWKRIERATLLCRDQSDCQLQFGMAAPTFSGIVSRGIATRALNPNPVRISYTLISANSYDCLKSRSFTAPYPLLQYRLNQESSWMTLWSGNSIPRERISETTVHTAVILSSCFLEEQHIQFRFVQLDHSGGFCDCWGVTNFLVTYPGKDGIQMPENVCKVSGVHFMSIDSFSDILDISDDESTNVTMFTSNTTFTGFCLGSASVPRGFVSSYFGNESIADSRCLEDMNEVLFANEGSPPLTTNCGDSSPSRLKLTFDLNMTPDGCNIPNRFDDGVELSFRLSMKGEWIPIMFYVNTLELAGNTSNRSIIEYDFTTADSSHISLRGYTVPFIHLQPSDNKISAEVYICGDAFVERAVEFRWLQTVQQKIQEGNPQGADVFSLDNVSVTFTGGDVFNCDIFRDDFDDQTMIDYGRWSELLSYNVHVQDGSISQCSVGERTALFFVADSSDYINSRQLVTLPLKHESGFSIFYTLITYNSSFCQSTAPLNTSLPQLQFRENGEWMTVTRSVSKNISTFDGYVATTFEEQLDSTADHIQFRFVQLEHRGGTCDCWAVANLNFKSGEYEVNFNNSKTCEKTGDEGGIIREYVTLPDSLNVVDVFCGGSASVARGFVTHKLFPKYTKNAVVCDATSVVVDNKNSPLTNCGGDEMRIEVTFDLDFLPWTENGCAGSSATSCVGSFNEGVELSFKITTGSGCSTSEWIPLMYFAPMIADQSDNSENSPPISVAGDITNKTAGSFILRGYTVPYVITKKGQHSISLCGDEKIFKNPLQFQWLQTASQQSAGIRDVVLLDNITISLLKEDLSGPLFNDDFQNQSSFLAMDNVHLLSSENPFSNCEGFNKNNRALFFYLKPTDNKNLTAYRTVSSRQVVIGPLDIAESIRLESIVTAASSTTTEMAIGTETENTTLGNILQTPKLRYIYQAIQDSTKLRSALENLTEVLDPMGNDTDADLVRSVTYLLSAIGNVFGGEAVQPAAVSEAFLSVAESVVEIARTNFERGTNSSEYSAGSTLLQVLDRFALQNHNSSHQLSSNNIKVHVAELEVSESIEEISPIVREGTQIKVPIQVLEGVESGEQVRMASIFYRNMSGLLPETLNNLSMSNGSTSDDRVLRLASPVISASFQCDNCTTSNLSTPVQVTFKHLPYDTILLENDPDGSAEVKCVFWNFEETDLIRAEAVLFQGEWSQEGCTVNKSQSTFTKTVCECDHLTNFAILLSARPPQFTKAETITLQVFGYIGTSISLVAMTITVLVFISLKPLRTMRNYIHIQLCVTLGIAQVIFVAGIQPNLKEEHLVGGVPVGCRLVAVLLHYWFLVSFMWMLMEGVVLYVALVRVFVKYHARYIAAFTIASYGIPLLYVGGLTVPLGFGRSEDIRYYQTYDYGYEQACYLSPERSFVWSFIAPVMLIVFVNIGFIIMASVIMYRHEKRQHSKSRVQRVRHWLKVSISLTVVMGITWLMGVLVIEVEELFSLAFIFTIFVAFQGLFIFVLFIIFSKQVRENYAKWWKSKVAESDFLSKHFGEKSLTTSLTSHRTRTVSKSITLGSSVATAEKFDLTQQSKVLKNSYVEQGPLLDEKPVEEQDYGNFFTVIFVPNSSLTIANPTADITDLEIPDQKKDMSANNVETELSDKRAVPNLYVDRSELLQQFHAENLHTEQF